MSVLYNITSAALEASGYRPLHAGDDYSHAFTAQVSGAALDLTGATLWLTVKEDTVDPDPEAKLRYSSKVTSQIEITDATNGKFTVHFGASDTKWIAGVWSYDIKVKLSTGKLRRLARGQIEFLPNITEAVS